MLVAPYYKEKMFLRKTSRDVGVGRVILVFPCSSNKKGRTTNKIIIRTFIAHKVAIVNLIKCWKYIVSKLDFSNRRCTGSSESNCKANNALLAQRCVENALISFTQTNVL